MEAVMPLNLMVYFLEFLYRLKNSDIHFIFSYIIRGFYMIHFWIFLVLICHDLKLCYHFVSLVISLVNYLSHWFSPLNILISKFLDNYNFFILQNWDIEKTIEFEFMYFYLKFFYNYFSPFFFFKRKKNKFVETKIEINQNIFIILINT